MALAPQHEFDVVLPLQDQNGNALVAGQLTQVDFDVTVDGAASQYSAPIDAAAAPGDTIKVPFAAVTPSFVPVAGKSYVADAFVVDAEGAGLKSTTVSWTQRAAAAAPNAPGFSVV